MRLVDFEGESFSRGAVFRVRGKYPYEKSVDFMIFDTQLEDRPYGLIVTSGYKAGLILIYLPEESYSADGGIDKEWVISNWEEWIYPDCNIFDVHFVEGYESIPVS